MKLSHEGQELITQFEARRNQAYLDSINKPTIGIGFIMVNGKPVRMGDSMTDEEIDKEFTRQIASREAAVNRLVTKPLTQSQFDALVSFVYNLGENALKNSTLLKKININPNDPTIELEFSKWVNAGGKKVYGLVKRRSLEASFYKGTHK